MINIHWLKNGTLQTGDKSLYKQWQKNPEGKIWIDISGETLSNEIKYLNELGVNQYAIQDIQRERHPPKLEFFDNYGFLIFRDISDSSPETNISADSLNMLFNENCLVTVRHYDCYGIAQIKDNEELVKYLEQPVILMCKILNILAKRMLQKLLQFEETIADLEDNMTLQGNDMMLTSTASYRTRLRKMRRVFAYHERIGSLLLKSDLAKHPDDNILHSMNDIYDKFERLQSLSSLYYDILGDLSDAYLSISSHQLNQKMQVLTIVTTIFVPMGFLAGLYGMNFDNIPELHHPQGYFILLGVMLSLATGLLMIFKWKKWL